MLPSGTSRARAGLHGNTAWPVVFHNRTSYGGLLSWTTPCFLVFCNLYTLCFPCYICLDTFCITICRSPASFILYMGQRCLTLLIKIPSLCCCYELLSGPPFACCLCSVYKLTKFGVCSSTWQLGRQLGFPHTEESQHSQPLLPGS
jgi:hypothetical protein